MKEKILKYIPLISWILSTGVNLLGFMKLIETTESKALSLVEMIIFLPCFVYWPYCIFMQTDAAIGTILEKDRMYKNRE